jgi:hypothetical protein
VLLSPTITQITPDIPKLHYINTGQHKAVLTHLEFYYQNTGQ